MELSKTEREELELLRRYKQEHEALNTMAKKLKEFVDHEEVNQD